MALKARVAAAARRHARFTRAAGWALLGGIAAFPCWVAAEWLGSLGPDWETFAWPVGLFVIAFITGLPYSGVLGIALWHASVTGWRRAAGFAMALPPPRREESAA
jgi:hypothetical protein